MNTILRRTARALSPNMEKLNINSKYTMNSGYDIPVLGYGVRWMESLAFSTLTSSGLPNVRISIADRRKLINPSPAAVAEEVTDHAIRTGYRHVDSATAYRNEAPTAKGMVKSGVPREQLFFTSKVPPKAMTYQQAKACVDESLVQTGLSYIDLYLLHSPYGGKEGRLGAWRALAEAVEAGKVRSIGVSNYGVHHLDELEAYIKETEAAEGKGKGGVLSVNQVELHPWLARPDIVDWCKKRGVLLEVCGT